MPGWLSRRTWCALPFGAIVLGACSGTAPAPRDNNADELAFIDADAIDVRGQQGVYTANRDGAITTIAFPVPLDRVDPARLHFIEKVDETESGVVLVLDRYASKMGAERSCADGFEIYARVFSLPAKKQLLAEPVESCLGGIEAADPPVTWLGGDNFRIEGSNPRTYAIDGAAGLRRIS